MDIKRVKEIVKLAKKEGVVKLEYETEEGRISVTLSNESQMAQMPYLQAPIIQQSAALAGDSQEKETKVAGESFHEVTSPFVGTFYRSSAPGEENYVKEGDIVSTGKVLCILEAMKIMNEIESDASGEIVEICAENESLVEFGQVLFKIRK